MHFFGRSSGYAVSVGKNCFFLASHFAIARDYLPQLYSGLTCRVRRAGFVDLRASLEESFLARLAFLVDELLAGPFAQHQDQFAILPRRRCKLESLPW